MADVLTHLSEFAIISLLGLPLCLEVTEQVIELRRTESPSLDNVGHGIQWKVAIV